MSDFFIIFYLKSTPLFHIFFFSIKWFFHIDLGFYIFFQDLVIALMRVRLSSPLYACGCRYFGTASGRIVSVRRFGFHRRGATF